MSCVDPLDFGGFVKRPSDRLQIRFDFGPNLARYLEAGKLYRQGDVLLPRRSTGFAYQAVADGTAGAREPAWPVMVDALVNSGSLTLRAIPALYNGLDVIINASVSNDGAIVTAVSWWEGGEAAISVEGGEDGDQTMISIQVQTQSGQLLTGQALCNVSNQMSGKSLCVCL